MLKGYFLSNLPSVDESVHEYPTCFNTRGFFFTTRDGKKINTATFVCIIVSKLVVSLFKAYQSCSEPASPLSTYSNTPTETGAVCYYFR